MKLSELYRNHDLMFSWVQDSKNKRGETGVSLFFAKSTYDHMSNKIKNADDVGNHELVIKLKNELSSSLGAGKLVTVFQIGWWKTKDEFYSGVASASGETIGKIMTRYPKIKIYGSKDEAISKLTDHIRGNK